MAIESDVLVVGGGIAGCFAAISAARMGADVRLVSAASSTLGHASGLIDVLGYRGEEPVSDPFARLGDLPVGHPYERVGVEAVRSALDVFDEVVTGYAGDHTNRNALVPTFGGRVKPTARYPARVEAGLASRAENTLLVGFETLVDFDAPLAADRLERANVPFAVRGVTLEFPASFRADAKVTRYARALDRDEAAAGIGARSALANAVEPHLDGVERVGFPAVLGVQRADEVHADLEARLGARVFEVPMGPPSLLGLELEATLYEAVDAAGVHIDTGNPVVGYESEGGRVEHVLVERTHQSVPYHAEQYVLATGGLVGKGIGSNRNGVHEPVFDCYVPHPDERYDWFAAEAFGDHPFARFGVDVDRELRPRDAAGAVEFENLRAAGSVLGGADFAAEKSGSGISLATGYAAGRRAIEELS